VVTTNSCPSASRRRLTPPERFEKGVARVEGAWTSLRRVFLAGITPGLVRPCSASLRRIRT
jgi:hypothetical protein